MIRNAAAVVLVLSIPAAACDPPPPIKTSSGMRIASVEYKEAFARSDDVHQTTFHGDRLRRAVELMDKNGVFALSGTYEAKGVLDSSTLTIVVRSTDEKETRIVVRNCAEPHVCAFMSAAAGEGVVERMPLACKSTNACAGSR
jgi:hypothetical protein